MRGRKAELTYESKVWWVLNRSKSVLDRFSGGITITMYCKAMRKKGYGFAWSKGQQTMRNGIHTVKKAKEVSDALFSEYGVFIPYLELLGWVDAITLNEEGGEI